MRRILVPIVFVLLVSLGAVLPVSAGTSDVIFPTEKACELD